MPSLLRQKSEFRVLLVDEHVEFAGGRDGRYPQKQGPPGVVPYISDGAADRMVARMIPARRKIRYRNYRDRYVLGHLDLNHAIGFADHGPSEVRHQLQPQQETFGPQ